MRSLPLSKPEFDGIGHSLLKVTKAILIRRRNDENSTTLELRPIMERKFRRFQTDLNPIVESIKGPGNDEGGISNRAHVSAKKLPDDSTPVWNNMQPLARDGSAAGEPTSSSVLSGGRIKASG